MVNMSNAPFQAMDLNQLYGIDENVSAPQSTLDGLNYYNRKTIEKNNIQGASAIQNLTQNEAPMQVTNPKIDMQQDLRQTQPQRQEQTFPTSRSPLENQRNGSNQNENVQLTGDLQSFLQQQVGKKVSVQFLIGANSMVEQSGTLVGVGKNYILLRENNGELLVCHIDALKFVRVENIGG